ncbi:MAG TPA: Ig-like domain-containing protein [Thiobacillaceae bacterium]|nr:Ig-like domain-containing protein [Thiobacillaceae bacterium]
MTRNNGLWIGAMMALPVTGLAANLPPTFTPIPAQTIAEGQTSSITVSATDPEGTAVTITAKSLKTWMTLSNKVLTLKPGLTHAGSYSVSLTATDAAGGKSTLTVPVTVTNTNQAPVLGALSGKTVAEGATLSFGVTATDADKDVVTITASPLKSWMSFKSNTFTATPGFADSGSYTVTFTASDGKLSSQGSMTITVTDVNQAPVFGTMGSFNVSEGGTLSLPVTATDPDGSPVTITATGLQTSWMSFDGSRFTATPDHTKAGSYTLTFTASDGVKQTKSTVTLVVADTNRAPVLTPVGAWNVGETYALSLPIIASDADGDAVTVTASGLQSWMTFDGRTFRARPGRGNAGSYHVTFTASDGKTTGTDAATINVTLDDSAFPKPWTQYIGSQWTGATWAGTERAWLGYLTGLNLMNSPGKINDLVSEVQTRTQARDIIITIEGFGGDGDGTNTSKMGDLFDLLRAGGLGTWQSTVINQIQTLATVDPDAKRIVYQLGNEITKQNFSDTLRAWAASRGITIPGASQYYDPELIPFYVEYYLAPTVEAANQASLNAYGDADKVNLALGSIGNGGTSDAQAFLDMLLNYQVTGTYSPSLAGKRVYELVDLITVHYPGATTNLNPILDKWLGVGNLKGLWTTETIGINAAEAGEGAGRAVWELGNNLGWYYNLGLTPDQTRVSFYGWDVGSSVAGTSADTSMKDFYNFFGDAPLEVLGAYATLTGATTALQTQQFNSVTDGNKRAVSVTTTTQGVQSSSLQSLNVKKDGWTGHVTATVHHYSPAGHTVTTASVSEGTTSYTVTLSPAIALTGGGDTVMVTLARQ